MGLRLYVAKKYEVEYGDKCGFNWKVGELHNLLGALDVYYTGEEWDNEFAVPKSDLREGIEKLKNLDSLPEMERENIEDTLNEMEYTADEVVKLFEGYLAEAEPKRDYLYFAFI